MRKAMLLVTLLIAASIPIIVSADENPVRQRSALTEFSWTGTATTVQISGEWDDWDIRTNLVQMGDDWTTSMDLDQGMYCYKLIVDDNWIFDPSEPYRGYCDDYENSIVRVPDVSKPMFTHSIENEMLTVLWHAGAGGGAPESTPFALATSLWDEETWTWSLDLTTLPEGKNTLHITGVDIDGNIAEDILLPFWNGPQADFVWNDALIYMIMSDRFVNGDESNDPLPTNATQGADWMGGDFAGVTQMIQSGYFSDIGVNVLWLTPFNTAADGTELASGGQHQVSAYHGYWPVAAREIDARLGTEAELHGLIEAAHDAGIRILGDFVINHVHESHPYFTDNPEWFNEGCLCGEENCGWTENRLDCMFRPYMPDVNWRVRNASEQLISDVMWWMENFDLDGGRLDAVKHVEDLAITNLAVRINERFETAGTDYYLKGETAMGWSGHTLEENTEEYGTINNYIGPDGLDGQADFVLYHAVVDNVFTSGDMDYQHLDYWTARSQDQYVDGSTMVPFVGSHDVPRFTSRADTGTSDAWNQWDEDGLPGQPGTVDPYQAALQAYTWLLTTPGAAAIYQGDEYGEFGGADPDNRHILRATPDLNSNEISLLENISTIGQLRMNSDALRRGTYASLSNGTDMIAWSMTTETDQAVIALNRGTTDAEFDLELDWVANDTLNGIPMDTEHQFTLGPHSVAIFLMTDSLQINETREPDGHCLTIDNLTVNSTFYVTLDLVNICDKGIHYPGVNATADNLLVSGFSGMVEWYYVLFANTSYNHSWQLILDENITNGTEITLTFEATILNCGEQDNWHDCPDSVLQHSFTVVWDNHSNNQTDNGTNNQTDSGLNGNNTDPIDNSTNPDPDPDPGPDPEPDSDNDGMPDYADICPDTEEGIPTDEYGCSNDQNLIRTEESESIEDNQSSSGSGDSQSPGGMTTGQLIKVALGVLTLIAGAFLVTLVVRIRNQDDELKFE